MAKNQGFSRQNGVLTLTNTGILGINIHVGAWSTPGVIRFSSPG